MSEHTREPWKARQEFANRWRIEESPQDGMVPLSLALVVTTILEVGTSDYKLTEANARRIVACVNACAGISTEELEQEIGLFACISANKRVIQQRDNLLSAAKITVGDLMDSYRTHGTEWFLDATKDLRNAIAEIEVSK